MTIQLLLFYLPSLIGLVALFLHFVGLFKLATASKSHISGLTGALTVIGAGLIISWLIVLAQAIFAIADGTPLMSWQVLLLPLFWGIILVPVNIMIRR